MIPVPGILPAMPPPHGATRYLDWHCRCEVCRGANAARARE